MKERVVDVTGKYNSELLKIKNKLNQLEKGRVYDISKAKMDGYLSTNVEQLREMISDLVYKIEYNEESIEDRMRKTFEKMEKLDF